MRKTLNAAQNNPQEPCQGCLSWALLFTYSAACLTPSPPRPPPNLCQHLLLPQCLIAQARSAPSLPSLRKREVSPFPCCTHPALSSPGFLGSTDSLSGEGAREEVPQPSVGSCELFLNIPVAPCPMSVIMFKVSWSLPSQKPGSPKTGRILESQSCQTNGAR